MIDFDELKDDSDAARALATLAENLQLELRTLDIVKNNHRADIILAMLCIVGVECGSNTKLALPELIKHSVPILKLGYRIGRSFAKS